MPLPPRPRRAWRVHPLAPRGFFDTLASYPPLVAQVLYNRGVRDLANAGVFLNPEPPGAQYGLLIPGADAAIARIARAVRARETVAVYGDFDADGITSAAILTLALRQLGIEPFPYIPARIAEGHGLNIDAVRLLHSRGVTLIITADCGITNVAEAAFAADLGVDLVITDHHTAPAQLPQAAAIVAPKLPGADAALAPLASCGVAYLLAQALSAVLDAPFDTSLLELVALGTIADVSPITGENRSLVQQGMDHLNRTQRPGIRALMRVAGVEPGNVDAEAIGFALAPRINAPGRMDHANPAYLLLTALTDAEAEPLARELDRRNTERRSATEAITAAVRQRLAERSDLPPLLFLGGEDFPPGVVGLAAGRLADEFARPAVVFHQGLEESRGSCRSIPDFNIIEALRHCDGLFTRYGGHAQAAGFVIPTARLPELEERLVAVAAAQLAGRDLAPSLVIDAQVRLERITGAVLRSMALLSPHGPGNPVPAFLARAAELRNVRSMGADGRHLRMTVRAGNVTWPAVAFNAPLAAAAAPARADIVFTLAADRWNGRDAVRLNLLDLAPPSPPPS